MTGARVLGMLGQFLVSKASTMAIRKNELKIESKGRFLPRLMKLGFELAGWGCFIYTGFLLTSVAGFIVAGIASLTFSWRIDIGGNE